MRDRANGPVGDLKHWQRRIFGSVLGVFGSVVMNLAVFVLLLVAMPDAADPRRVLTLLAVFWGSTDSFRPWAGFRW